ncbi:MAG TPA: POT family MFS transporter [Anaeromyxobacteraceae bacterium]|nr:POT family MFS transporter [Anaeromyxobacteraceae bacterium]
MSTLPASTDRAAAAPAGRADRYPPQSAFIVGNEGCERFSFYGMRAILVVYMVKWLAMPEHEAKAAYHLFMMACYVTPLAGGWLADRFWGRYRVILWLSLGYVAGHATLAVWETRWGLAAGLGLIAIGSGGIKPCVSALLGDQFRPDQRRLLERVFALFYWMINLGSFSAKLVIPKLLAWSGPGLAFAVPGVLMAIALVVFWAGRRRYVMVPPSGPNPHSFLRVLWSAARGPAAAGVAWLDRARAAHPAQAVDGARAVLRVAGVFAATLAFWALFDQQGSSWILQAQRMDGTLPWGGKLEASQIPALNPLLVLTGIPLIHKVIFPALERLGVRVTPLGRMTSGMFLATTSFAAAGLLEAALDGGARLHVAWQLPQYLTITAAEILVSVTALEFAYTQAPRSLKSTVMSVWFLTSALGNLLTATVSHVNRFQGPTFFWFFAALMLGAAVLFALVARAYRPVTSVVPAAGP